MTPIVILTGAGISAESGLGTFRDKGGIWTQYALEDVATPEGFARNPALVHDFYNRRRADAAGAQPNAAHMALARLQQNWPGPVTIVTQNVDALHEAGGAQEVIHMHGELAGALCASCGARWTAPLDLAPDTPCPVCTRPTARPDVVWFGEMPYHMETIYDRLANAGIFAAIGTSGQVYPAAGFVQEARAANAHTVEINLDTSDTSAAFGEHIQGPASETVPAWVNRLLDGLS